jgi:error-prone DNA polymerase
VIDDYRRTGLSLKIHPAALLRPDLAAMGAVEADSLRALPSGRRVKVAGHLLVRQMPGSANGTVFLTIEDETGTANVIVWPSVFERFRAIIIGGRLIGVTGPLQNEHGVIHIVADRVEDLSHVLVTLGERTDIVTSLARADEFRKPQSVRAKAERSAVGAKSLAAYRAQLQGSLFPERPDAFIPHGRSFQ